MDSKVGPVSRKARPCHLWCTWTCQSSQGDLPEAQEGGPERLTGLRWGSHCLLQGFKTAFLWPRSFKQKGPLGTSGSSLPIASHGPLSEPSLTRLFQNLALESNLADYESAVVFSVLRTGVQLEKEYLTPALKWKLTSLIWFSESYPYFPIRVLFMLKNSIGELMERILGNSYFLLIINRFCWPNSFRSPGRGHHPLTGNFHGVSMCVHFTTLGKCKTATTTKRE